MILYGKCSVFMYIGLIGFMRENHIGSYCYNWYIRSDACVSLHRLRVCRRETPARFCGRKKEA